MLIILLACTGAPPEDVVQRTNTPPVVTDLSLAPVEPITSDFIVATPILLDLDGDEIALTWRWEIDGDELDVDGDTLPAYTASKGETVDLTLLVSDGFAFGESGTASTTIINATPLLSSVTIEPETPGIGDSLTCVLESSDDDGDELSAVISWFLDGEAQEISGPEYSDDLPRNSQVYCQAVVDDGELASELVSSQTVTVGNSPPTTPGITLEPDPPTACAAGEVQVSTLSSDPDDDPIEYRVSWRDASETEVFSELAYPVGTFADGEQYSVAVWAHDGFLDSEEAVVEFQAVAGGESLGNGLDDDCDGAVDEWITLASQAQQIAFDPREGALTGEYLAAGDTDGDGLDDLVVSHRGESSLSIYVRELNPGEVVLDEASVELDSIPALLSLALVDTSGDGAAELLLGATGDDTLDTNAGAVVLLPSSVSSGDALSQATWSVFGEEVGQALGQAIDAGDLDGDGLAEILIGLPEEDAPAREQGELRIFSLGTGTVSLADADVEITGFGRESHFGDSVSVLPDIDGDGYANFAVGAPEADTNASEGGAVGVWTGLVASGGANDAPLIIASETRESELGRVPPGAGDVDGDGLLELAVPTASVSTGAVLIYAGTDLSGTLSEADAWTWVEGPENLGIEGQPPLLFDQDGDGLAELVLGWSGGVAMWPSDVIATGGSLSDADATIRIDGETDGDEFGEAVVSLDSDGDGRPELAVGAPRRAAYADRAGALYVFRPPWGDRAESWEPSCKEADGRLYCRVPSSWDDARVACQALGLDLARPDSDGVNAKVGAEVARWYPVGPAEGRWWIGLSDGASEGTWSWLDETTEATFTAWESAPSSDGSRTCARLTGTDGGVWEATDCDAAHFYICE